MRETNRDWWLLVALMVMLFVGITMYALGHEESCETQKIHLESGATNAEVCR